MVPRYLAYLRAINSRGLNTLMPASRPSYIGPSSWQGFLAATKQLYEWFSPSVCLSVTPFSPCSHHRIIITFSRFITNDKCDVHAKGQGQRSKVKVTEVKTKFSRFRTITPIGIHIWWWNNAQGLVLLRRGALLFWRSSVKFQGHTAKKIEKSSILTQIGRFCSVTPG